MSKTSDRAQISSMDDDDDIMEFLREKDNEEDYSLFELAVSKLKDTSNILEILDNYSFEDKPKIFEKSLPKLEEADDEDIKSFLESTEHDPGMCKKLLPKMENISDILEVLDELDFDDNKEVYRNLIPKFEDADDEEIKDFLQNADYDPDMCTKLFPKLGSTSVILEVLDDLNFEDNKEVYRNLIPTFEEAEDDEEIKDFLNKIDDGNPEFFQKLLPKMGSISEILEVLDELDFENNKEIYRGLVTKFADDADDEDIKSFIEQTDNDPEICKELIPKMKNLSEIIEVLSDLHIEDNRSIFESCIVAFEDSNDDDDIKSFLREAEYDAEICIRLIPKLSSYSETLEVLGELEFDKEEDRKVFESCIKEFEDADDSAIKDFLDATGYDSEFCKKLFPKMSETSDILEVLGNLQFEGNEESYRGLVPIFESADDSDIKDFLREADYDPEICEKLFPKIGDNQEILDLLGDIDFDDNREVFEVALEFFKESEDDDIKSFLDLIGYNEDFCKRLLPYVEDDDTKDEILEEVPALKGVPLYKEGPKRRSYEKPKQIFQSPSKIEEIPPQQSKILVSTPYEKPSFSLSIQPSSSGSSNSISEELKGKSDYQIIDILKKYEDNPEMYRAYLFEVHFEEWTDFRISNFLERSRYNPYVCVRVIPCIKSDFTIDSWLDKIPSDQRVFQVLIPRLGLQNRTEFQLTTLLERTKYSLELCKACISFLSTKEKIFLAMERTRYNEDVCNLGLNRLRSLLQKI